jgi:hypothetical protein
VPGVFVGVSSELAADGVLPADYLGELELADCTLAEELHYDDGLYVGEFNVWADCGGTATMFIDWAALDASASYLISAQFTVASEADIDAVVHALDSLYLTADLVD